MSSTDPVEPQAGQALAGEGGPEAAATTSAARLAAYLQGGGVIVPLLTAVLAFFVGGMTTLLITALGATAVKRPRWTRPRLQAEPVAKQLAA